MQVALATNTVVSQWSIAKVINLSTWSTDVNELVLIYFNIEVFSLTVNSDRLRVLS